MEVCAFIILNELYWLKNDWNISSVYKFYFFQKITEHTYISYLSYYNLHSVKIMIISKNIYCE